MSWVPPARPRWVVDHNALGELLGVHALHPIASEALLATATAATALDDLGGDTWRAGFELLCASLRDEAGLHAVGALLARSELLRTLQNRLRIVAALAASPEVESAPVTAPWFVCGTARSGTSILHELLAQDPTTRAPAAWELMYSVPAPRTETYESDPRIALADREVRFWDEITPEYLTMHENGGALPQECIFITGHEFASEHWSGVHDVPTYNKWLQRHDLTPAYRWHLRHLQWLQSEHPGAQWVLKAPSHLSALPALFAVYPDAWIVQTHRDPLRTVPSTISLMATLRWMRSDRVDADRLARTMATGVAMLFDFVRSRRLDGTLPDDRFIDVRYADLLRDPVATIRGIYDRTGREFTPEYAAAIPAYLAAKPQAKHGAHRYTLDDFGLDADELRDRYRTYCDAYGIEHEGRR